MGRFRFEFLFAGILLTAIGAMASADDAKDEVVNKDHKLIEGAWNIVSLEVNGNRATEEDARKFTVVNGSDGTWSLRSEGNEISKGTSTFDPTLKPKTIDFTPTEGSEKGKLFQGIYELSENTRKLCFAPAGDVRPTEFSSASNSGQILVVFEREKTAAVQRDRKRIEGTWVVVALELNGNKSLDEDARKLQVIIGADGSWSVTSEGTEINQGTSNIDPFKLPKAVDFTPTVGDDKGKQSFGVYEVGESMLKFCVSPPGKQRPGEFTSTSDNEQIFLTLERVKTR